MRSAIEVRQRAVWRLWRRWLPSWYRERYESDLIHDHIERSARLHAAPRAFWLPLLWDALATGMAARLETRGVAPADTRPEETVMNYVASLRQLSIVLRRLARQPAFTLGVILTLGLALGASLTMFSILDRLLLRPPAAVTEAGEVRRVYVHGPTLFEQGSVHSSELSYPEYEALTAVGGLESSAAYSVRQLTVGSGSDAERVRASLATTSYFELLGVRAVVGRLLQPEDDVVGAAEPVVVLSHDYWRRRLGGQLDVVGRQLVIGKSRYTIVGVAEARFTGVDLEAVDVWLPLHAAGAIESGVDWLGATGWSWLRMLVRLPAAADGHATSVEAEASVRLHAVRGSLPARVRSGRVVFASLIPARGPNAMSEADVARLLFALTGLVLLIGCANVVNLLLARSARQRRQYALQRALGASRGRIAAELMLEAAVLVMGAGALAFAIAGVLAPAVFRLLLPDASTAVLAVDRTLIAAAALVTAVVFLIGIIPSYRASRTDAMESMRTRGTAGSAAWIRSSLLFVQAAVSIVLLVGAGLFVRSLQRAVSVDVGLETQTLSIEIELEDGTTFGSRLAPAILAVRDRLESHPSVQHVSVTSILPWGGGWGLPLDVPGLATIEAPAGPFFVSAGPDYFRALGVPVLEGRALNAEDMRAGAEPVVVVNEAMARLVWLDESPLGNCLLIGGDTDTCTRVVGVAGNYRANLASDATVPLYYIAPHHPGIGFTAATALIARVHGDSRQAVPTVRLLVHSASPEIRFVTVAPLAERLEPQLRTWRAGAATLTIFGILALIVAAAGLYSMLAFDLAQRRFELAVRAALGAGTADIARTVAARTLLFTSAGIAAGTAAALLLGRMVQSLLFEAPALDLRVHAYAIAALVAAAIVASLGTMRRARMTDPMDALRQE